MTIYTNYSDLPQKITNHFADEVLANFVAAIKTTYKPHFNIPMLWLVIHKNGLIFCNTHKTRGLFKKISLSEIDSIRINMSSHFSFPELRVLLKDLGEDDFVVTLPTGIDIEQIELYLKSQGIQIV